MDSLDAMYALQFLFGSVTPTCQKACDTADTGTIEVADVVYLLLNLFVSGAAPPDPFLACNEDPTEDSLACEEFGPCR